MSDDANDMDVTVHWVAGIPVADLKSVSAGAALGGEWVPYKKVRAFMDRAAEGLESLRSSTMSGDLVVGISKDLASMSLIEYGRRRSAPDGGREDGKKKEGNPNLDCETLEEADARRADAVAVGESLLRIHTAGEIISAEHYLGALASSPDIDLTMRVLAMAGWKVKFYGRKRTYIPSQFKRLPAKFESEASFRVLLSDYGELQPSSVQARMDKIFLTEDQEDNEVGEILAAGSLLPVFLGGSMDGMLFLFCATAGIPLEAEVTVTVDGSGQFPIGLSLVRLVDPDAAGKELEAAIAELQRSIGGSG